MPTLFVGCPMWAHRPWVGRWFRADTPSGTELAAYASWNTTVEGNTTHYATPSPAVVARWVELAPPDFRFCFKVPRMITHDKRLRNCAVDVQEFLHAIEPLHANLGPVQLQLPATFGPEDLHVLADACAELPRHVEWAVETRHPEFSAGGSFERTLNDLLATHGMNRVMLDSRTLFSGTPADESEQEARDRKPRLPVRPVATARQPLVRFIGVNDSKATMAGWAQWVPKVAQWCGQGLTPHVFIHTPNNLDSPDLARRFHADVARILPALGPLPEPVKALEQLRLDGGSSA